MTDQGRESYDRMYVTCEITVPARGGRTYLYRRDDVDVRHLWADWLRQDVELWLTVVRSDLERGDRT